MPGIRRKRTNRAKHYVHAIVWVTPMFSPPCLVGFSGELHIGGSCLLPRKRNRGLTMVEARGGESIELLLPEDRLFPLEPSARETAEGIDESVRGRPLSVHADIRRRCGLPRTSLWRIRQNRLFSLIIICRMCSRRWRSWLGSTTADHGHPTAHRIDLPATDASGGFDFVARVAYGLVREV